MRSFVAVVAALCSMKRLGKCLAIYVAVMFAAPWLALSALTPDQIEQGYQRLTLVAIPSAVVLDGMIAFSVFALVLSRVRRRLATVLTSPLRSSNSDSASRGVAVAQGWRNLPGSERASGLLPTLSCLPSVRRNKPPPKAMPR